MARLMLRQESRGLDEGVPPGAIVGSMSLHTAVLGLMVWGASHIDIPPPPQRAVETRPAVTSRPRRESRPAETREEQAEERREPAVEERPAAPPEQAAEGRVEMPVRLEGAPFPYPEYLENIILQIKRHWRPPTSRGRMRAELAFTILRDGSVADLAWVRRSGNPAFDLEARGAIEAAARRGAFGPLPEDYPSDRLRVSFFFDPTRY